MGSHLPMMIIIIERVRVKLVNFIIKDDLYVLHILLYVIYKLILKRRLDDL